MSVKSVFNPLRTVLKIASSFVKGRNNTLPFTLKIPEIFNHMGFAKVIFAINSVRLAGAKKKREEGVSK